MYNLISKDTQNVVVKMDNNFWLKFLDYVKFNEETPETYQLYDSKGVDPKEVLSHFDKKVDGKTADKIYIKK